MMRRPRRCLANCRGPDTRERPTIPSLNRRSSNFGGSGLGPYFLCRTIFVTFLHHSVSQSPLSPWRQPPVTCPAPWWPGPPRTWWWRDCLTEAWREMKDLTTHLGMWRQRGWSARTTVHLEQTIISPALALLLSLHYPAGTREGGRRELPWGLGLAWRHCRGPSLRAGEGSLGAAEWRSWLGRDWCWLRAGNLS